MLRSSKQSLFFHDFVIILLQPIIFGVIERARVNHDIPIVFSKLACGVQKTFHLSLFLHNQLPVNIHMRTLSLTL